MTLKSFMICVKSNITKINGHSLLMIVMLHGWTQPKASFEGYIGVWDNFIQLSHACPNEKVAMGNSC